MPEPGLCGTGRAHGRGGLGGGRGCCKPEPAGCSSGPIGCWRSLRPPPTVPNLQQTQRQICEAKARLNDRTAPGVTLGVRRLTRRSGGLEVEGTGEVVGWAVEMWRLPADRSLSALLAAGRLDRDAIDAVAIWLGRFHHGCPEAPEGGTPAEVADRVEAQLAPTLAGSGAPGQRPVGVGPG